MTVEDGQNKLFVCITSRFIELGVSEIEVLVDDRTGTRPVKRISFPETIRASLQPVEKITEEFNGFNISYISQEDIDAGQVDLPNDSVNLSLFSTVDLRVKGQSYQDILMNAAEFHDLSIAQGVEVSRDQICFSRTKQKIIVLPGVKEE